MSTTSLLQYIAFSLKYSMAQNLGHDEQSYRMGADRDIRSQNHFRYMVCNPVISFIFYEPLHLI